MRRQVNQYDKIFKENIEAVIPNLMQNILGITAVSSEELPNDIQHTKERKPDVLEKVTDVQGNTFVLQIEFQVVDEPKMIYRMAEYCIMLMRKYELPVEQFVIFLGSSKPAMLTQLDSKHIRFEFTLISFAELDYHLFLKSAQPEEIVLGVLADFQGENPEEVLTQLIQRIEETTDGDFALKRYFSQLRVLAQLRNLGQILRDLTMNSIANFLSVEKDAAYMIGQGKTEERIVQNLIAKMSLTTEQIADLVGVSIDFVEGVRQKLSAKE